MRAGVYGGGIGHQTNSNLAGAAALWAGVLIVEAAVALALAAIFAGIAQIQDQVATWPSLDTVSCDKHWTAPVQPDSSRREIVRPQP